MNAQGYRHALSGRRNGRREAKSRHWIYSKVARERAGNGSAFAADHARHHVVTLDEAMIKYRQKMQHDQSEQGVGDVNMPVFEKMGVCLVLRSELRHPKQPEPA